VSPLLFVICLFSNLFLQIFEVIYTIFFVELRFRESAEYADAKEKAKQVFLANKHNLKNIKDSPIL